MAAGPGAGPQHGAEHPISELLHMKGCPHQWAAPRVPDWLDQRCPQRALHLPAVRAVAGWAERPGCILPSSPSSSGSGAQLQLPSRVGVVFTGLEGCGVAAGPGWAAGLRPWPLGGPAPCSPGALC